MRRSVCCIIFVLCAFFARGQFFVSTAQNKEVDWRQSFVKKTPKRFEGNLFSFHSSVQKVSPTLKMSILGDSYSTYKGYVSPDSNEFWYADSMKYKNNLRDVTKTWWWMLKEEMGWTLEKNNSYSGATICNTGYNKRDFTHRSFVTRMKNIGEPDILFIFGGTNDCWAGSPLGEYKYGRWIKSDLYKFRPAFAFMINYLKKRHPKMRIINICNSDLKGGYNSSMEEICKHYQIENIQLKGIDKQHSHPSIVGMREITEQLILTIKEEGVVKSSGAL